jgi:fumarate hydratase subunit alpha
MRELDVSVISEKVAQLCIQANCVLGEDVLRLLEKALQREESPTGREIIEQILENNRIARQKMVPMCQDTGMAVVFVELGQDVHLVGGDLYGAINKGVAKGYTEGYLRKSVLADPLRRKNTGDNTPAVIYVDVVPGDGVKITVLPKGGGSENMSALAMLPPSAGLEGAKRFVVEHVEKSGANPCPPVVVGVGIGGSFDRVALLAKRAHLREVGTLNPDPFYAQLERELLEEINRLGIGPQGFGGRTTALAVHIEAYPCHITGLPVAVNLNCHAARHKSVVL